MGRSIFSQRYNYAKIRVNEALDGKIYEWNEMKSVYSSFFASDVFRRIDIFPKITKLPRLKRTYYVSTPRGNVEKKPKSKSRDTHLLASSEW